MLAIHITAGLLALLAGAIALSATKGSPLHRKSGMAFVLSMLVMAGVAVFMAAFLRPNRVNVVAGTLTLYLVCTGLLAVRRPVQQVRGWLVALMLLAFATSAYAYALGMEGLRNANGRVDQVPPQPLFMFCLVALVAGVMDARMLAAGAIQGAHRIARHLWRMSFAMWIATASFFLGQAKFFPTPVRKSGLLAIPVLLVLVMLFVSLYRTLRRRPGVGQGQGTGDARAPTALSDASGAARGIQ